MKHHLKTLAAPKSWQIARKEARFVTRPMPGAHPFSLGMPLSVVLKDVLGYASNAREVRRMLLTKSVLVDGKRKTESKFIVGLMDVIEIPEIKECFRILLNRKGRLCLAAIKKEETEFKPCKIVGKHVIRKNRLQINLHDGRSVLTDNKGCKIGDTLIMKIPGQEVSGHLKLEKGAVVFLVSGKHTGETGVIENLRDSMVVLKMGSELIETLKEFAFVIGKDKPVINMKTK